LESENCPLANWIISSLKKKISGYYPLPKPKYKWILSTFFGFLNWIISTFEKKLSGYYPGQLSTFFDFINHFEKTRLLFLNRFKTKNTPYFFFLSQFDLTKL
jgi:hypothetical protein